MNVNHEQSQPQPLQRRRSDARNTQTLKADQQPLIHMNNERKNEQDFQQTNKGCSGCIIL